MNELISRGNQDLGINQEEKTTKEGVEYRFILVHKQKYCDSHPIYKRNIQFPDQAANMILGSHGERGVYTPLGSEIRT